MDFCYGIELIASSLDHLFSHNLTNIYLWATQNIRGPYQFLLMHQLWVLHFSHNHFTVFVATIFTINPLRQSAGFLYQTMYSNLKFFSWCSIFANTEKLQKYRLSTYSKIQYRYTILFYIACIINILCGKWLEVASLFLISKSPCLLE